MGREEGIREGEIEGRMGGEGRGDKGEVGGGEGRGEGGKGATIRHSSGSLNPVLLFL